MRVGSFTSSLLLFTLMLTGAIFNKPMKPHKVYESITDGNGRPAIAGVDGDVLPVVEEMPVDWLIEAPEEETDGPARKPKFLRLQPMIPVRIRFTEKSFLWLKFRLVRHYWHGL